MSIYDQPPLSFIQQALLSQLGGAPAGGYVPLNTSLQQAPAPSYYGPTHQALSEAFKAAIHHQMQVPGLLSQWANDPAMASQIGGFKMQSYTPNVPVTGINWNPPPAPPPIVGAGVAPAAGGWLQARGVYPGQNTVDFGSDGGATVGDGGPGGAGPGPGNGPGDGVGTGTGESY